MHGSGSDAHGPGLDRSVPALLVKIGRYPQHHGGVGVLRTLGRGGVAAHAMVEGRFTPAACSRYAAVRHVRPTSGLEPPAELVALLLGIGRGIGRRSVAVPTDDEAAVLLAEHADLLAECFLLPPVPAGLPRLLADKGGLHRLCEEHGVAARARGPCRTGRRCWRRPGVGLSAGAEEPPGLDPAAGPGGRPHHRRPRRAGAAPAVPGPGPVVGAGAGVPAAGAGRGLDQPSVLPGGRRGPAGVHRDQSSAPGRRTPG
ncbi:hypothetical protein GXW82_05205 [Streptacidiphilus sp. 4-A2]|nr:hypothetical protein [Streptacidiphilus sp. 4-A2]